MLVFFWILLILNLSYSLNAKENEERNDTAIQEKIKLIDSQDLSILETFFRSLFQHGTFAYTLFEYKPLASHSAFVRCMDRYETKNEKDAVIFDIIGWNTWEKYSHLFPSKNFIFKCFPNVSSYQINLINKKLCTKIINEYLTEFQKCFGNQITSEALFEILTNSPLGKDFINNPEYHACLGLLFGFGEKNSKTFEQRDVLLNLLSQVPYDIQLMNEKEKKKYEYFLTGDQKRNKIVSIDEHKSIKSINEELNNLQKNFKQVFFLQKFSPHPIEGIGCIGFDDSETKSIDARYEAAYQQLADIFNSENFLELILTQLSS